MTCRTVTLRLLALALLGGSAATAQAALPVVDVGAIGQLVSQLHTLENQLATARSQLLETQNTLAALSGTRGMQALLSNVDRNYLPTNWSELDSLLSGASSQYKALAAEVQQLVNDNALLSQSQMDALPASQRQMLQDARRSVATMAALSHAALATASDRFTGLQSLISAIGHATDPKAIYDLQARVQAETSMLQNDASKLQSLYQAEMAQSQLRQQRAVESAIADQGSLRTAPALGL